MHCHTGTVRSVEFSRDAQLLLTSSDDKSVKIWSLPSRRFSAAFVGHSNWVRAAAFSPDAAQVASASDDCTVRVWDVSRGACTAVLHDFGGGAATCVRFSPDGSALAAGGRGGGIAVWDARAPASSGGVSSISGSSFSGNCGGPSGEPLQRYAAHAASVTAIAFHASGHYLLSSSLDGTLKIWDLREGHILYTLHGHRGGARAAAFSADGALFVSGGDDAIAMLWRTNFDGSGAVHTMLDAAAGPANASMPAPALAASQVKASAKGSQQRQPAAVPRRQWASISHTASTSTSGAAAVPTAPAAPCLATACDELPQGNGEAAAGHVAGADAGFARRTSAMAFAHILARVVPNGGNFGSLVLPSKSTLLPQMPSYRERRVRPQFFGAALLAAMATEAAAALAANRVRPPCCIAPTPVRRDTAVATTSAPLSNKAGAAADDPGWAQLLSGGASWVPVTPTVQVPKSEPARAAFTHELSSATESASKEATASVTSPTPTPAFARHASQRMDAGSTLGFMSMQLAAVNAQLAALDGRVEATERALATLAQLSPRHT